MHDSWLSRICAWAIVGAAAAGVGAFLYAAIFRAKEWTHPAAARGAGIGVLGLFAVGLGALVHSGGVEAAGVFVALAGAVWAGYGLAD
jgi:hypothetical protein